MGRHEYKWAYVFEHALPTALGWLRTFFQSPGWALRLLVARTRFFFSRQLPHSISTPDQFVIESGHQLVSYWSLFIERECWASEWIEGLAQEQSPLILDVGANAGLFTHLLWCKRPDAEFIAFEPLPLMARKINAWKTKTGAKLTLHEKGVSDHTGSATFHASEEGDPTASLKPDGPKSIKLTIPLVDLDSIIPSRPIFLMKVDVEGCEPEVIAGGKQTISRARFLIFEAHTVGALEKIQKELGVGWLTKRVGASDYLFSRIAGAA